MDVEGRVTSGTDTEEVRSDQHPVNNLPPSSTTAPGVVLPPASMQSYLPPVGEGDTGRSLYPEGARMTTQRILRLIQRFPN